MDDGHMLDVFNELLNRYGFYFSSSGGFIYMKLIFEGNLSTVMMWDSMDHFLLGDGGPCPYALGDGGPGPYARSVFDVMEWRSDRFRERHPDGADGWVVAALETDKVRGSSREEICLKMQMLGY